jgi:Tfp pilus assembly major pilin PilA
VSNKFKIKLKVTGFELEIEGNREDVPLMAQAVGQQMSGFLIPASGIVEGEIIEDKTLPQATIESQSKPQKKQTNRRRSTTSTKSASNSKKTADAIDWKHNPMKWGSPQQDWTAADKSIWLLYVVSKESNISELTGSEVSTTFNKHFRQSGQIKTGQINRDLAGLFHSKECRPKTVTVREQSR